LIPGSRTIDRLAHRSGAAVLATVLAASAACAPGAAAPPSGSAVVRVGWTGSPDSLHPGLGLLFQSYTLFGLVYDALVEMRLEGGFAPSLAESWTTSTDGLEWTFRIRSGATFHDGSPVTAHDVVYSFELYRAHAEFPYLHAYTEPFASVAAPDERTFVLRLTRPVPNLESQIVFLFVLPRHLWEGRDATTFANQAMIGSGPFRLVATRQNEFVRLAAHRAHPVLPPAVDEVVFVTYGTLDALVQALRTGELDAILGVPFTAVAELRRAPNVEVATGMPLSPNATMIEIDQLDPARCPKGGVCSGHPALRDLAVRRALALATPKQELIDVVLLGQAAPGKTLLPDGLVGYFHRDLVPFPYDPDAARRELDAAGYRDRDGDGVRETPDGGRSLAFRFFFPSDNPNAPRTARLVARAWASIGVRIEPRALDPNAMSAARAPAFDYDLLLWSWTSDPDPNFMLQAMTGEMLGLGGNHTGWSDPEYDEVYRRQAATVDLEERYRLVWRLQEIAQRDVVYIVPFYERSVEAFRTDRFRGWRTDAPGLMLEDRSSLATIEPVSR
jgi:peptide/nickel transport system substrate-binding protein